MLEQLLTESGFVDLEQRMLATPAVPALTLMGIAVLLFGVALLLGGVAAFLDGWTLIGSALLLLGIVALLAGVAFLYRPELPRRLVAWLTKRNGLPLTAHGDDRD